LSLVLAKERNGQLYMYSVLNVYADRVPSRVIDHIPLREAGFSAQRCSVLIGIPLVTEMPSG
jgi:hypothetical protein